MRARRWVENAMLRAAALLVPGPLRAEWLAEWSGELWFVREQGGAAMAFCLGAVKDACWLRRNPEAFPARTRLRLDSPAQCLLLLGALAAAAFSLAYLMPATRNAFLPSPYTDVRNLVLVSSFQSRYQPYATVSRDEYEALKQAAGERFTGLAFYEPIRAQTRIAPGRTVEFPIARASANLFSLLGVTAAPGVSGHAAALILSHRAWRKYFDCDPQAVGRAVEIAGQQARVAAVVPDDLWRLPGEVEGWLLVDGPALSALPGDTTGYVLGHMRKSAAPPRRRAFWQVSLPRGDEGRYDVFECHPLVSDLQNPFAAFLLMGAFACLILPSMTSLSLGEYPAHRGSHPWARRIRQGAFLTGKIALLVPIVYFGTLDLIGPAVQPHGLLVGFILGFRWALVDQRRRCPVCLRLLTNPVRVTSQGFLGWNGTELICTRGHGLLHVPDISTSWFSTQRWFYLDHSWRGLFAA